MKPDLFCGGFSLCGETRRDKMRRAMIIDDVKQFDPISLTCMLLFLYYFATYTLIFTHTQWVYLIIKCSSSAPQGAWSESTVCPII